MAAKDQSFRFSLGAHGSYGFAMGHPSGGVTLSLQIGGNDNRLDSTIRTTPERARAIANALYEAADFAENTLASGLGESAVDAGTDGEGEIAR